MKAKKVKQPIPDNSRVTLTYISSTHTFHIAIDGTYQPCCFTNVPSVPLEFAVFSLPLSLLSPFSSSLPPL